jgi:hypothetical protein
MKTRIIDPPSGWKYGFPKPIPDDIKEGLVLRWAYDDKKTLNMRTLSQKVDSADAALISKFDKEDAKKKYKENVVDYQVNYYAKTKYNSTKKVESYSQW